MSNIEFHVSRMVCSANPRGVSIRALLFFWDVMAGLAVWAASGIGIPKTSAFGTK